MNVKIVQIVQIVAIDQIVNRDCCKRSECKDRPDCYCTIVNKPVKIQIDTVLLLNQRCGVSEDSATAYKLRSRLKYRGIEASTLSVK